MLHIVKYLLVFLVGTSLFSTLALGDELTEADYSKMRARMVHTQIRDRGVTDPGVLQALIKVKRHLFVPEEHRKRAYGDYPLPIGEDQTISQPYIVALMTEVLQLADTDTVLEIGTGSGYQAAVLAELCKTVYTIEIVEPLGKRAKKLLADLKYDNLHVKIGDGYKGWPEFSPFDAVIVTCAPTHIPQPLVDQLAEGGRMVIPVGERGAQKLVLLTKKQGKVVETDIFPVRFVPMTKEGGGAY